MFPTAALREKAAALLAADATTLAPATDANVIALIINSFNPGEDLSLDDITFADFDGSTPIACGTGTQPEALDPNTSNAVISIKPPAGGFRFETTGVTNLPQTVFGFALLNDDSTVLLASEVLTNPITLTAINQLVQLPPVLITQTANSMF